MDNLLQEKIFDIQIPQDRPEYIICSAVYVDDGKEHVHQPTNITTGYVVCGFRHHHCQNFITEMNGVEIFSICGFMTSKNRFVDRREAYKISRNFYKRLDENAKNVPISLALYSEDIFEIN